MPRIVDLETRRKAYDLYHKLGAPIYKIAGYLNISEATVSRVVSRGVNYDGAFSSLKEKVFGPARAAGECRQHPKKFIRHQNRRLSVQRAAYSVSFGDPPEGSAVCASCGNPRCVAPEHLTLKRRRAKISQQTLDDLFARYGEVIEAWRVIRRSPSLQDLAKRYKISYTTLEKIIKGDR